MRTTITLDDDVATEIDRIRRVEGIGLSEAINRLVREGLDRLRSATPYRHRTAPLGLKSDLTSIPDVLEALENPMR
jgi:hypothetical protein